MRRVVHKQFAFAFLCVFGLGGLAAEAGTVTLDQSQLLQLNKTFHNPVDAFAQIYAKGAMGDDAVGFGGFLGSGDFPGPGDPATIGIGASVSDLGLEIADGDALALRIKNLDQSAWDVGVYAKTSDGTIITSDLSSLNPGGGTSSTLDLSGVSPSDIVEVGLVVHVEEWAPILTLSSQPSDPDRFLIQASPVPEPATMALLGMGASAAAFAARRRRKKASATA